MKLTPVIPRKLAVSDIEAAVDYYLIEAGEKTALGFIDALEKAFGHISRRPASGSPRYAHELGLPGLRFRPLKRYPCLIFHIERENHVDVWRVPHEARDIPAWMQEPGEGG